MKTPKIKFSYNYSRGSVFERQIKGKEFNKKLFDSFIKLFDENTTIPMNIVDKNTKCLMPEKIAYRIKKGKEKDAEEFEGLTRIYTHLDDHSIARYRIEIQNKDQNISISQLPTIIHEMTHLFDFCANPKFCKIYQKIDSDINIDKTAVKILDDIYYSYDYRIESKFHPHLYKFLIKNKTLKMLKGHSNADKITILDYVRTMIQTEINAYGETQNYAMRLKEMKKPFRNSEASGYYKKFNFDKKQEILKEVLVNLIKKERYNNAQKVTKNPIKKVKLAIANLFG